MRWGDFLDYLGGSNVFTRLLLRGRQVGQSQRQECAKGSRGQKGSEIGAHYAADFADGGRGHELRNASGL